MWVWTATAALGLALAGCLAPAPETESGMAEVRTYGAMFRLDGPTAPFVVELPRATETLLALEQEEGWPASLSAVAVIPESEWLDQGNGCKEVEPMLARATDGLVSAMLEPGRYVVAVVNMPASAAVTFGHGPEQPPPSTASGMTSGAQGQGALLMHSGEPIQFSADGPTLVAASVTATPRAHETWADQWVTLEDGDTACAHAVSTQANLPRTTTVWAWVDGDVTADSHAAALPVAPESMAAIVHMQVEFR